MTNTMTKRNTRPTNNSHRFEPHRPPLDQVEGVLRELAERVSAFRKDRDMEGQIQYSLECPNPKAVFLSIRYVPDAPTDPNETSDVFPAYHVMLGNRYFTKNMLRVKEEGSDTEMVIEANEWLLLAILTF
jgi:hypothetical protein